MDFLSRADAKQQGLKRYCDGSTCIHGHTDERYTSTGHCVVCRKVQHSMQRFQDPEKWKEYRKQYYQNNRSREIELNNQWRVNNKEVVKRNQANWKNNNLEKTRAYLANRRAAKKNATPVWMNEDDFFIIQEVYQAARDKEQAFGNAYHVDHIVPLQNDKVCGLHVWWNLQVLPASENFKKSNRFEG